MPIDKNIWRQHAIKNYLQSLFLLIIMAGFLSLLGLLLWGEEGIFMLFIPGLILLIFNPLSSPWLIMRMYRARPLSQHDVPGLYEALRQLSQLAELPQPPTLFYIPSNMVNAFTLGGRNDAVIALTEGLLQTMNKRELLGVLAHELSHIRNNDMWLMGLADLFSRLTSLLSLLGQFLLLLNLPLMLLYNMNINWFALMLLIVAPGLSALAQLALSRSREYNADLGAALLTNDADGLASALLKIERVSGSYFEQILLPGRKIPEPSLLRTHPPTKERIHRLMALKPSLQKTQSYYLPEENILFENNLSNVKNNKPRWHITGLWH